MRMAGRSCGGNGPIQQRDTSLSVRVYLNREEDAAPNKDKLGRMPVAWAMRNFMPMSGAGPSLLPGEMR